MSNDHELARPFRLAFRSEGNFVNCYLAKNETMEGAMLIGSIMTSILDVDPSQFELYRGIMQAGIAAAIKHTMGVEVQKFDLQPAPEHEKSGNA